MNRAYLVLGSNLEPERHLQEAVRRISQLATVQSISHVYESPSPPSTVYWNLGLILSTPLSAVALKKELVAVEEQLGRKREPNDSEILIDIDLVLFNGDKLNFGGHEIPHPDVTTKAHAAVPLAEMDPEYIHPESGETLRAIAARLMGTAQLTNKPDIRISCQPR